MWPSKADLHSAGKPGSLYQTGSRYLKGRKSKRKKKPRSGGRSSLRTWNHEYSSPASRWSCIHIKTRYLSRFPGRQPIRQKPGFTEYINRLPLFPDEVFAIVKEFVSLFNRKGREVTRRCLLFLAELCSDLSFFSVCPSVPVVGFAPAVCLLQFILIQFPHVFHLLIHFFFLWYLKNLPLIQRSGRIGHATYVHRHIAGAL